MVETVNNEKLATQLDKAWPKSDPSEPKLSVMVQVNTSGEQGTYIFNLFYYFINVLLLIF